jgi:flagellin-like hook-associated protein FlgL
MADIALSKGVRQNLLSMQSTVDLMGRTQNRLATGKKVNSALDNPTNYFVAAGLDNRSNDLSRLLDSMGLGIKTLEAADNGIKSIKKLIETAQGTARQALQAASLTARIKSANQTAYAAGTTTASLGISTADTLKIDIGSGRSLTITLNAAATDTIGEIINAINSDATATTGLNGDGAVRVRAGLSPDGKLQIENLTGGDIDFTYTPVGASTADLSTLFGTAAAGTTANVAGTSNTIRSSLADQFESLKSQIDQIIKDTSYNGVNLLNGDTLKVLFNETNTTSIDVQGVVFDSQGLGMAPVINGKSADSPNGWQSDFEISAALAKLDAALNTVRTQASNFGSNLIVLQTRQDFTKQSILTLNAGADLLTLADTSEEGANLLALQTRQQLSTQALSLASQTDQAVLRLFG